MGFPVSEELQFGVLKVETVDGQDHAKPPSIVCHHNSRFVSESFAKLGVPF